MKNKGNKNKIGRNDPCPCGATNKKIDVLKLHQLYEDGQNLAQLGELVGVHGRTIGRWFADHELPIRNRSERIKGEMNPSFKGTPCTTIDGYVRTWKDGKRVLEHRAVMEEHLDRQLLESEQVHHINGIRLDNRLENLKIVTSSTYRTEHKLSEGQWSRHYERCVKCGTTDRKHAGHGMCTNCHQHAFDVNKRGYEVEYQEDGKQIFSEDHIKRLKAAAILRESRKKYKKCCMNRIYRDSRLEKQVEEANRGPGLIELGPVTLQDINRLREINKITGFNN